MWWGGEGGSGVVSFESLEIFLGYPKLGSQCKDKLFYGGGR